MPRRRRTPQAPSAPGWEVAYTRIFNAVSARMHDPLVRLSHMLARAGLTPTLHFRMCEHGAMARLDLSQARRVVGHYEFFLVDGQALRGTPGAVLRTCLRDSRGKLVRMYLAGAHEVHKNDPLPLFLSADEVLDEAGPALDTEQLFDWAAERFRLRPTISVA